MERVMENCEWGFEGVVGLKGLLIVKVYILCLVLLCLWLLEPHFYLGHG
jgi:hypothetical protein